METEILGSEYLKLHGNGEIKPQNAAVTGYCNEKPWYLFEKRKKYCNAALMLVM
jgi:hypothetical protein